MTERRPFESAADTLEGVESAEERAFLEWCAREGDSPEELGLYRTLSSRLRGEESDADRPSDDALLRLRSDPESLEPGERERLDAWLESHPAERDAFQAFRALAATARVAPERVSWLQRAAATASSWMAGAARAAVPAALAAVLTAGFFLTVDPLGRPGLTRGDGERGIRPSLPTLPVEQPEASVEMLLLADQPNTLTGEALPPRGDALLRLVLPQAAPGRTLYVRVESEDGARALRQPVDVSADEPTRATLALATAWLVPGTYRVELRSAPDAPDPLARYVLEVR